jgi:NAD(P)-dependent dehydrogenase (short-subunit alcohol dehydrogenase family)
MSRIPLEGAVVVVTGAGSGIGRETAVELSASGARVALVGRRLEPLEETSAAMSDGGMALIADVTDPAACEAVRERVLDEYGRVDILVNNAGISMRGEFGKTDPAVFRRLVEVDLLGPMVMTRVFIADIAKARGAVCFVSSLAGLYGLPEVSAYSASKMGLTALAQSLRAEYAGTGTSFTVVHIGLVDNDPDKRVYGQDGSLIPLHRPSHATRRDAASYIINATVRRTSMAFHTPAGKLMAFFARFFPSVVGSLSAFGRLRLRRLFD